MMSQELRIPNSKSIIGQKRIKLLPVHTVFIF